MTSNGVEVVTLVHESSLSSSGANGSGPTTPTTTSCVAATSANSNVTTETTATAATSSIVANGSAISTTSTTCMDSSSLQSREDSTSSTTPMLREWQYPLPACVVADAEVVAATDCLLDSSAPVTSSESINSGSPQPCGGGGGGGGVGQAERFSGFYSLPVATFVRDLVRTSMDHIHDHIQIYHHQDGFNADTTATTTAEATTESDTRPNETHIASLPLSVRSDTDARAISSLIQLSTLPEHQAISVRTAPTLHDYMNEEAEFILVDGDLIAVQTSGAQSTSSPQGEGSEANSDMSHQPKAWRPSRMQRGVRKIGKWFGRGKKKNARSSSLESAAAVPGSAPAAVAALEQHLQHVLPIAEHAEHDNNSIAAAARTFARQASIGETSSNSSPSRRSVKKNKANKKPNQQSRNARRSWRQREESKLRDGSEVQDLDFDELGYDQQQLSPNGADGSDTLTAAAHQIQARGEQIPNVPPTIPAAVHMETEEPRQSVIADQIGTVDQVLQLQLQSGALPPAAEVFIEYEFYGDDEREKKDEIPVSLVPVNYDYKVDKADVPDVDSLLLRASYETNTDLEHQDFLESPTPRTKGKSDGSSVPLSQARRTDKLVHNDMLKVLLVGSVGMAKAALARAIRESPKKPRKRTTLGLDVHTWSAADVHFHIWDVQGSTTTGAKDNSPNFGADPGTQSLFFSGESLYLLVWDLACHNPHVNPILDFESDEEEDEFANAYGKEQAVAEADRALQEDITSRVLAWVDRIARRAPGSAVLPVAIIPEGMEESIVEQRCSKMFEMLESHVKWHQGKNMPNIVLDDSRNILCVNETQKYGIKQIQDTMIAIAKDSSRSVFEHVGTPVPPATVEVLEYIRSVKRDHKLIRLDHILGLLGESIPVEQVVHALHFLASVGEILYFGTEHDDVLSSFVILSRQWLVSALSCILRNDLKRELADARKFMNMQCIYSEQKFQENEIIKALSGGDATCCPLLTDEDAAMLWRSMSFMREAADRYSQLNERTTSAPTMFYFLVRLLVHFGIFIPFGNMNQNNGVAGLDNHGPSEVFFVPSLLTQADPGDIWGYRSADAWTTTLCHSWLFRDGAPSDLFEHVAVAVLRDIYLFSREFMGIPSRDPLLSRSRTTPLGRAGRRDFVEEHQSKPMGPVKIHQVICWKNAMLLKIGTVFPDRESDELRESFVEVFVTIVDQNSTHCVASDAMRGSMQRVIVSGKGQSGLNGLKLFKGGYQAVLDSVKSSLECFNNVNMQVVCPECLARVSPGRASTWGWDEVAAAAEERRESTIVCRRGHRVKSGLLCGTTWKEEPVSLLPLNYHEASKSVPEILPGVVLVGLWDPKCEQIHSVGSGFVADKKFGLIVTAGHVLFDMTEGRNFGTPYLGMQDAKVAIGLIPEKGKNNAVWRYFAEILVDDVRNNVDACVLRLTTRMEHDVDDEIPASTDVDVFLDPSRIKNESLSKLKVESNFELEERVRILGYSQRESIEEPGHQKHILRSPDFAMGYICRVFSANTSDDSSSEDSDCESKNTFTPREEIVVRCPTIVGHSGGPCVNDDGLVVGILSRADPTDPHLCYLVPALQIKNLVRRARNLCSRTVFPTSNPDASVRYSTM